MNETYTLNIVSNRHGRGSVCFFDEPFGEQTPFEWAGGFTVVFDTGAAEGGPISSDDLIAGLDVWLKKNGWRRLEEIEALVEV